MLLPQSTYCSEGLANFDAMMIMMWWSWCDDDDDDGDDDDDYEEKEEEYDDDDDHDHDHDHVDPDGCKCGSTSGFRANMSKTHGYFGVRSMAGKIMEELLIFQQAMAVVTRFVRWFYQL